MAVRERDVWTDNWPDHYLRGTWAKKYKDWDKAKVELHDDLKATARFHSRLHTQPSRFNKDNDTRIEDVYGGSGRKSIKSSSTCADKRHKSKKRGAKTESGSHSRNVKETGTVKKLTWDPNADFHDDDDDDDDGYTDTGGRLQSRRGDEEGAYTLRRSKSAHHHSCSHDGHCSPVGYFYNQVDPWMCQFCGGLDRKRKHTHCTCLADKLGIMAHDRVSEIDLERRAHVQNRRNQRRKGNPHLRSVEEMAYRMNMAARSGKPIDYHNHMECKVHWRM